MIAFISTADEALMLMQDFWNHELNSSRIGTAAFNR